MNVTIRKWGHSLGIRIPSIIAKKYNFSEGSTVEIIEEKGKLIITPGSNRLELLLEGINDSNIHNEVSTGKPAGKELW